ncbi:hypothetical protein NKR23_g9356 [Pleurostoma richardsiae]|uniref:Uncharacterized protein n=1 Tax=Pleurostoma richardsiae TaxID=41990 RepID=A0AA38VJR3_9PEZI|nr:hypothetical protein NKR23_g9356 [Pleurostoma richardsiae]
MSNEFHPPPSAAALRSAVVVLVGGATGIGRATALALHTAGAHVVIGDITTPPGDEFESVTDPEARNSEHDLDVEVGTGSLRYLRCDISNYKEVHGLFQHAWNRFGRVDHAVACAGILERGKLFDPELTVETVGVQDDEALRVLQVNLVGAVNFSRVAVVFLRTERDDADRSLTLLGSVASIRESAGLFMYQTSKHGILGLLRSMRTPIYKRDGIRVNCICPGMTESAMTTSIIGAFRERNLATQTSEDVAKVIIGLLSEKDATGKAMYVEGAKAWEFEETMWETMPAWLGEEPTKMLKANAEFVASGALLKK